MFNFSNQIDALKSFIIGLTLILACTILGIIWISIGLYQLVAKTIGPMWGPVVLGLLFLLPIAVYFINRALPHNKDKRRKSAMEEAFANSTVGSMSRMIDSLSATSPVLAAVAAVVAGFMATRFPQFLPLVAQVVVAVNEEMQGRKVRKAERKAKDAREEYERTVNNPSPPDIEPINKRRRRKEPEMYE